QEYTHTSLPRYYRSRPPLALAMARSHPSTPTKKEPSTQAPPKTASKNTSSGSTLDFESLFDRLTLEEDEKKPPPTIKKERTEMPSRTVAPPEVSMGISDKENPSPTRRARRTSKRMQPRKALLSDDSD